jgi:MFS family permease
LRRDSTLLGLLAAVFLMMVGVGMIMALLPRRVIDLTGSGATVGYLSAAFGVTYIAVQLPVGNLADRFGFKPFLIAGYLLCFATGLVYFLSPGVTGLFLGRLLQGAGEAPVWALAPALLSLQYPAARGRVMGLYNGATHLGLTLGPLLGVVGAWLWHGDEAFLFYAVACLAGAVVLWLTVRQPARAIAAPAVTALGGAAPARAGASGVRAAIAAPAGAASTSRRGFRPSDLRVLAVDPAAMPVLVGVGLLGAWYGLFLTNIPAFLMTARGFGSVGVGIFFSLFYLGVTVSQVAVGAWSDRRGRAGFMVAGLVLAALAMASFSGLPQPWISLVLTVASLGMGVFSLSAMAFLNEVVPDALKGTASGAYYLFWGGGLMLGPVLLGRLAEAWSYPGMFAVFAGLLVLQAAALAGIWQRRRRVEGEAAVEPVAEGRGATE